MAGKRLRTTNDAVASCTQCVRHVVPDLSAMSATLGFGKVQYPLCQNLQFSQCVIVCFFQLLFIIGLRKVDCYPFFFTHINDCIYASIIYCRVFAKVAKSHIPASKDMFSSEQNTCFVIFATKLSKSSCLKTRKWESLCFFLPEHL